MGFTQISAPLQTSQQGTVTIEGDVVVASGTIEVSSGSIDVASVAGVVDVTGSDVAVSSVAGVVDVTGSSVDVAGGTVDVGSVSGAVNVQGGTVTVENTEGTNLLNAPTLTQQATVSKTATFASPQVTFSVPLNPWDRVMLILCEVLSGSGTPVGLLQGTVEIASVTGGTTGILYTPLTAAYAPFSYLPLTTGTVPQASPLICPVIGGADSSVNVVADFNYPGATNFTVHVTFTVFTAPDPSIFGTSIAPFAVSVMPTPTAPITHVPAKGTQTISLPPSGSSQPIPSGYSWLLHYLIGSFSSIGGAFITDGLSGLVKAQINVAATGRQEFNLGGRIITGTFTINYTFAGSSLNLIYDVVKTPVPA